MDKQTCRERLKEMNCLVVIPTYNNEGTVLDVIRDVLEYAPELLVVNDGSTDSTSSLLHGVEGIRLLEYSRNRGKGGALKLAIRYAVKHGFSYMLTLDADGQHYADDIPVFVEAAMQEPDTLFVGARNLKAKNMPGANSFANRFSNFWYMVDTGKRMSDTQSGYRLYPLEKLGKMHFLTGRYEFEVEIIVRAAWNRIPVKNIPIRVWYAPKEERVSHFKPLRDFGRISLLNTGLFLWAILIHYPWIGISYFTKGDVEELKHIIASTRNKPGKMAASMGWGVFCGIIPAWGYQTFLAGVSAYALRLNKLIAMGFSTIGIPPLIPVIIIISCRIGAWATGSECLLSLSDESTIMDFILKGLKFWEWAGDINVWMQYFIGSFLLASFAGLGTSLLGYVSLAIFKSKKSQKA